MAAYVGTYTASYSGQLTSTTYVNTKRGDTVPDKSGIFMGNHSYIHQLDCSIDATDVGGGFSVRSQKWDDNSSSWSTVATQAVTAVPSYVTLGLGKYPSGDPNTPSTFFRVLVAATNSSDPPENIHIEIAALGA